MVELRKSLHRDRGVVEEEHVAAVGRRKVDEHKMVGVMEQLGMSRFAFPIDNLVAEDVTAALDEIFDNRDAIGEEMLRQSTRLQAVSARTTELAVELLRAHEVGP